MEIVTGSTGQVHVTPIDDAVRNSNVGYLDKRVVFTWLNNFSATILNNNQVRINSGYGINQGRIFKIDENEFDVVNIDSGSQGYKRADIIAARYTMNTQSGFENIELVVIKGESRNSYVDPTYSTGNINRGATLDDMPMYRVKLNGLTIEAVERMFTLEPDGGRIGQLEKKVSSNLYTNLASETAGKLTGATNVDIGIKGTLPISHGGTGATTAHGGFNALANGAAANTTTPADTDVIITKAGGTWYQKTFSKVWDYIAAKVRSLLGITNASTNIIPVGHGGTGLSTIGANKMLVGTGSTSFGTKTLVTAMLDASTVNDSNIPTTKAVSDAMSNRGYGDMLSSYYATTIAGTTNKVIAVNRGGTGQTSLQATRNAMGLGNTTGALPAANGGTGQTSLQATRNAMGLGNTTGALPIANGGTGSTTVAAARNALGLGNTSGALPIANGGTGQTTAAAARNALGLGNTTGALPVANGGTGATSASAARTNLGAMSSGGGTFSGNVAVATGGTTGRLTLGNSTETSAPSGAGSTGALRIYGQYSYHADLYTNSSMSSNQNYYLPKSGGTLITNQALAEGTNAGGSSRLAAGGAGVQGEVRIWTSNSFTGTFKEDTATLTKNRVYSMPNSTGIIQVSSSSSRRVKKNIQNMTEERAKKLLDLDIVNFDYIGEFGGGLKDQSGVIAEDAVKVIPEAVLIPEKYDETKPVDEETNPAPSVDYRQYIPYLIKMVQMQQKEIEALKKLNNIE